MDWSSEAHGSGGLAKRVRARANAAREVPTAKLNCTKSADSRGLGAIHGPISVVNEGSDQNRPHPIQEREP